MADKAAMGSDPLEEPRAKEPRAKVVDKAEFASDTTRGAAKPSAAPSAASSAEAPSADSSAVSLSAAQSAELSEGAASTLLEAAMKYGVADETPYLRSLRSKRR